MSFPQGEWSPLLIGHQWPSDSAVTTLRSGQTNRGIIERGFSHFGDVLHDAQTGPLVEQEGRTADDIRNAFRRGEEQARQVAQKNGVKKNAYTTAHESMLSLRQDLTTLAEEGNQAIKDIKDSNEPPEIKVAQIVGVVQQHRALANLAAAKYGGNVLDAIQSILDEEGTGQSARQFAQAQGINIGQMFRQPEDQKALEDHVRGVIGNPGSDLQGVGAYGMGSEPPQFLGTGLGGQPGASAPGAGASGVGSEPPQFLGTGLGGPPGASAPGAGASGVGSGPPQFLEAGLGGPPGSSAPAVVQGRGGFAPSFSGTPQVSSSSLPNTPSMPAAGASPLSGTPLAPPTNPTQGVIPANLTQDLGKGLQTGAPMSAAADAVPSPAPMESQPPPSAPTTPSAGAAVPVHSSAFDAPPPVEHASTPPPTTAAPPPVVTGPTTPAAPFAATPPPAGPLPAYGADLRLPTTAASTPAPPPGPPPSTAAGSAPVHPAAGQAGMGQPAVVRQPLPATTPPSPSSVGTRELAATAGGAIAGAASAEATARTRLQRLVAAVAHQQPRLAWAAGDRADNTTVLVTDLASGWIPPGIAIPAAVTLLEPARRRGDLETLLGQVNIAVSYNPIHYLPDADDDEPVATSPRPRRAPQIDELGWELNQATHWRDGLPRLAHTLAIVASTGTGVLDSEVDLLRDHLNTIAAHVLDSYPEHVNPHDVGNWQLLAAIDALVAGDKTAANYHLAWFRAS